MGVVEARDRAVGAQGEVLHTDAGADGGPGVDRGFGQPLGDLPEPAPRVEEGAPLGPAPAHEAADDGARPGCADPSAGELTGELARIDAPDLADVRAVELVGDGRTEPGPDDLGEGVLPGSTAGRRERGIARGPQRERPWGAGHQVGGPQREGHPAPAEQDAPVAGPDLEVVAEQRAQGVEQARGRGRVEAVAAEVDAQAGHLVAGRHAPDPFGPFDHGDLVTGEGGPPGGDQSGRTRADDQEVAHPGADRGQASAARPE